MDTPPHGRGPEGPPVRASELKKGRYTPQKRAAQKATLTARKKPAAWALRRMGAVPKGRPFAPAN